MSASIMINGVLQNPNLDEPVELRELSKSKIYSQLASQWFLPQKESRGVTRAYLVQVHRGDVFRVQRQVILEYECRLTAAETRKSSFYSVALLYDRLEAYLVEMQQRQLGFSLTNLPEEDWFSRILRYVDPHNVLEGFAQRVSGSPTPPVFSANA